MQDQQRHHQLTTGTVLLLNCDVDPKRLILDEYMIMLWNDTAIEQHKAAVSGVDLEKAISYFFSGGPVRYVANLNQEALKAVRGDLKHVQVISCNTRVFLDF